MVTHDDVYLPRSQPSATTRSRGVNKTDCFGGLCCFVSCIMFMCSFGLIIATILINLLGKQPLHGEIPTMEIDTIKVSNLNLSNPITAHWNINMNMHSSGSSFDFSRSTISIFHESKDEALWMMSLKKFDMRPKNSTFHFALHFWGSSADVDDTTVKSIGENIMNNLGAVKFNVQFKAENSRTTRLKHSIDKLWFKSKINMLVLSCDVWLLFGSLDYTHAEMLKTGSQQCILATYDP